MDSACHEVHHGKRRKQRLLTTSGGDRTGSPCENSMNQMKTNYNARSTRRTERSSMARPVPNVRMNVLRYWSCFLLGMALLLCRGPLFVAAHQGVTEWALSDLKACNLSSAELRDMGPRDFSLDPCIIADELPPVNNSNKTAVLTLIMVTNHRCSSHRDGAVVGVRKLNQAGARIGFYQDHTIYFRFMSVMAGNSAALSAEDYDARHQSLLRMLVDTLQPHYIVGTCSPLAHNEKEIALNSTTMLMAAVGPPSFYLDDNPWLFGMHINSNDYPIDSVRRLTFWASDRLKTQPVRVIYRTRSEFFFSTCQAAIDALEEAGFENVGTFLYDPAADDDGDGVPNEFDEEFLNALADQACAEAKTTKTFQPALFMCTIGEQNVLLERMRQQQCTPSSIWLTAATWTWALQNTDVVPYFQGGGQWHEAFPYSDDFFESGAAVLEYVEDFFGYQADYDAVVQYSMPMLFAQHLQAVYRVLDNPDPLSDFLDPERREFLRRQMVNLVGDTLFGPVIFDENQRNVGRQAASSQWLPVDINSSTTAFRNALVSPILLAEAAAVVPSPSSEECDAGSFVNVSLIENETSILTDKCSLCPVDTFSADRNRQVACTACRDGTTTLGEIGAVNCVKYEDNLLSNGILGFGYAVMGLSWLLALASILWVFLHRSDPVVRLAQIEYLLLICLGAMISSSSILALSFQAGTGEDTTAATRGCMAVPFLYTIGWGLQYGSLLSKTYRLVRIMNNDMRRVQVTLLQSSWIVAMALALDFVLVLTWTFVNPLEYIREVTNTELKKNILTIESDGRCRVSGDISFWAFAAPILVHHVILMVATNCLLWRVKDVHDRYQEQKYIALAAVFVLEVVVIGVPVLIAARDSVDAQHVVIVGIITMADIGVLCFTFIPKVIFQRKGLEAGVGVGESIMRNTHRKAVHREARRSVASSVVDRSSAVERASVASAAAAAAAFSPDSDDLSDPPTSGIPPAKAAQSPPERNILSSDRPVNGIVTNGTATISSPESDESSDPSGDGVITLPAAAMSPPEADSSIGQIENGVSNPAGAVPESDESADLLQV